LLVQNKQSKRFTMKLKKRKKKTKNMPISYNEQASIE
jgi:hypothetical protein